MPDLKLIFLAVLCTVGTVVLQAQTNGAQHFNNNESAFNPAFTGKKGAVRLSVSDRSQWGAATAAEYSARTFTYEETMPCFFLDYGFFFHERTEGEGQLKTTEFGGRVAAAFPLSRKRASNQYNLRIGFGLTAGQRSINFGDLTFLDQLNPFFGLNDADGNANPTGFQPSSGGGLSPRYTTPSLGFALKGGLNLQKTRSTTFDVGVSVHNLGFLVGPDSRQTASLLGLDNALGERWVFSGVLDHVFAKVNGRYWSVRPLLLVQQQAGLGYLEAGAGVSWNKNMLVGAYYHQANPQSAGANVNWTSLQVEVGSILPGPRTQRQKSRIDLALSYSFQYGRLKNTVRPPLELTATFSFGTSGACALLGYDVDGEANMARKSGTSCHNFTSARNRLYDNIWYRDAR
ncbi:type IX secretion system membrane protein PorP/SprF [Neolewinella aurantiaca]|uniref:Type IX secretion system membrane protein PorP/SprF n=1 Tax=Neolewinella aurantiaca TaxID=2602767 RepID=A0A5C7FWZ6_9BACT|nr:type IX secretion system membrane protein PorP/SprF [Neolewinella aurantiaca]TXF91234.1 type IX secretion system membrane protein PorP/SprF [Neolewinella aurantiaca]